MGLSSLGIIHTAIAMLAVLAGIAAFFREGKIDPGNRLGLFYVWTTILTCLTSFGIFHHGGFNKAHVLGILTLLVLLAVWAARRSDVFGRFSAYVVLIGMSTTFFFHMIPGFTETLTRLPVGAPVFENQEADGLKMLLGGVFVIFLIGVVAQVRAMRQAHAPLPPLSTV